MRLSDIAQARLCVRDDRYLPMHGQRVSDVGALA